MEYSIGIIALLAIYHFVYVKPILKELRYQSAASKLNEGVLYKLEKAIRENYGEIDNLSRRYKEVEESLDSLGSYSEKHIKNLYKVCGKEEEYYKTFDEEFLIKKK